MMGVNDTYDKEQLCVLKECANMQEKELEALKLIYVLEGELIIENETDKEKHTIVHINLTDENLNDNIIKCVFELPKDYPLNSFLLVDVKVKEFTEGMNSYINEQIYKYMQNYSQQGCILNIVCKVNELIENLKDSHKEEERRNISDEEEEEDEEAVGPIPEESFVHYAMADSIRTSKILARRLCYSHHIKHLLKRNLIIKWARELNIGGYSKIGYPGIIVCEGRKEEVDFYVMSLNKLRWKHFDCRGMEDIVLEDGETIDEKRVLPKVMREIGPNEMSTLSNICTECGLRDLFLTSMKIYHPKEKEKSKNKNKETEKGKEKEKETGKQKKKNKKR